MASIPTSGFFEPLRSYQFTVVFPDDVPSYLFRSAYIKLDSPILKHYDSEIGSPFYSQNGVNQYVHLTMYNTAEGITQEFLSGLSKDRMRRFAINLINSDGDIVSSLDIKGRVEEIVFGNFSYDHSLNYKESHFDTVQDCNELLISKVLFDVLDYKVIKH